MGDEHQHAFEPTPERMSGILGAPVATVTASRIGDGLVGMNLRLSLEYVAGVADDASAAAALPASVVVKLPSPDPVSRQTGVMLRNYEREVCFYRELAGTVDIRVPRCHHAEWDPSTGDFAIVLEDAAPARQGDQVAGCSPAIARDVLVQAARLHGPRWADPTLDTIEWLGRRTGEDDVLQLEAIYAMCWPGFLAAYGAELDQDQIELGERFGSRIRAWLDARTGPLTVTHGDFRLDNMLFTESGGPDGDVQVVTVDWQTPGHGPAVADVAYFLGAGLLPKDRRVHERELVELYAGELERYDVRLDPADCWEQYRRESFAGVVMSVVASQIVGRTERSDAMFTAMATRHFRHALDLDAERALG